MGSMGGTEAQPSQGPCPTSLNLPSFCSWGFSDQPFARYFEAHQGAQEFLPALDMCFGDSGFLILGIQASVMY